MTSQSLQPDPSAHAVSARRVNDRLMLWIVAGLLFVVAAVSLARWNEQVSRYPLPAAAPVAERTLLFVDGSNGNVQVLDAQSGLQLHDFPRGEGSFVRGVVRSLTRARSARAMGLTASDAEPFRLQLYADGRLVLSDPLTGERIELNAFGPTNAGVFQTLLGGVSGPAYRD